MDANNVLEFLNRDYAGRAEVVFPKVIYCPICKGIVGINHKGKAIIDPELGLIIAASYSGYILRMNEERAARGCFRKMDGHDGWPEDWQFIPDHKKCACTSVEALQAIADHYKETREEKLRVEYEIETIEEAE